MRVFNLIHLYPRELNLYGDTGNVFYISYFLSIFGIKTKIYYIEKGDSLPNKIDFIFAGGGPDSLQSSIYKDFLSKKGILYNHIHNNKPALFICGSYQLLGKYYLTSNKEKIKGLNLFNFYTFSPNNQKKRLVGNSVICLDNFILTKTFKFSRYVVGFQNHNGRTILSKKLKPLGKVLNSSLGNDSRGGEGFYYNKTIGTYLHGPLLVKNPHILYFLLSDYLSSFSIPSYHLFYNEFITHYEFLHKNYNKF